MLNLITAWLRSPRAVLLNLAALGFVALAACTAEPPRADEPSDEAVEASADEADEGDETPPSIKSNVPLRYFVKKGDTLWKISSRYLNDPWRWPQLWYANPKVKNPHRIYPGEALDFFYKDGRPILARAEDAKALKAGLVPAATEPDTEIRSPKTRDIGSTEQIPAISTDAIRNFLTGPRLVTRSELRDAPYLLDFVEEHIFAGHGQTAYVRGIEDDSVRLFEVVREGEAYRDPETGDRLGYEALPIGEARLIRLGDVPMVEMTKSYREVRAGDRLLPLDAEPFGATFYPHAPAGEVGGRIIALYNGLAQIGQYQVVTINRGSEHGLEAGHVLQVLQTGRLTQDRVTGGTAKLPDQHAGTLMLFRVTPRLSYALVMNATRAIHVKDRVEKPE